MNRPEEVRLLARQKREALAAYCDVTFAEIVAMSHTLKSRKQVKKAVSESTCSRYETLKRIHFRRESIRSYYCAIIAIASKSAHIHPAVTELKAWFEQALAVIDGVSLPQRDSPPQPPSPLTATARPELAASTSSRLPSSRDYIARPALEERIMEHLKASIQSPLMIWGSRGMGKSTLLKAFRQALDTHPNYYPVLVKLQGAGVKSTRYQVYAHIADEFAHAHEVTRSGWETREIRSHAEVRRLILRLSQSLPEHQSLVIMLDDIDFNFDDNSDVCRALHAELRDWPSEFPRVRFVMSGCVHPVRYKLIGSPLYSILQWCSLNPLGLEEVIAYARATGWPLPAQAHGLISELGGLPRPIRQVAHLILSGETFDRAVEAVQGADGALTEHSQRIRDRLMRLASRCQHSGEVLLLRVRNALDGGMPLSELEFSLATEVGLILNDSGHLQLAYPALQDILKG